MRKRNWRLVAFGVFLIVIALGLFVSMTFLTPQSTDPVELMRLTGQASGAMGGVGIAVILTGLIGKKQ